MDCRVGDVVGMAEWGLIYLKEKGGVVLLAQ